MMRHPTSRKDLFCGQPRKQPPWCRPSTLPLRIYKQIYSSATFSLCSVTSACEFKNQQQDNDACIEDGLSDYIGNNACKQDYCFLSKSSRILSSESSGETSHLCQVCICDKSAYMSFEALFQEIFSQLDHVGMIYHYSHQVTLS